MHLKLELWLQGLRAGRTMRFRLGSESMVPTLQSDDLVTVAPGRHCRLGDIALCQQDQDVRLHRVVARWGDWIVTKGDGLTWLDDPIPHHVVLGTAVARERRGRVRRLDRMGARLLGLAWCLTSWVPGLLSFLAATKRTLRNAACPPPSSSRRLPSKQEGNVTYDNFKAKLRCGFLTISTRWLPVLTGAMPPGSPPTKRKSMPW